MMAPELEKLNALLTRKQTTDLVESTDKEIFALQQEVAMRRISVNAAGQFVDAQRQAALAVKLYTINQQPVSYTHLSLQIRLERSPQCQSPKEVPRAEACASSSMEK